MTGQVLTSRQHRWLVPMLVRLLRGRSLRKAAMTADLLDRIVDRDLVLVRAMPMHLRARPAEKLANLVMLAQTYRHYATGWISRRELQRRRRLIFDELTVLVIV